MNGEDGATGSLLVTVFGFPGVRLLDVAGPIGVFTSANEFGGRYRLILVSADGNEVCVSPPSGRPATSGSGRCGCTPPIRSRRSSSARRPWRS
ncbi:hypothetical protein ACFO3J_26335 [Streptomyces polygonati]|uniref:Uncharacterized protein n=1 Tax=Streptomyces polygonati TaxID=1617087 RepID=A0ABV8HVM9_9ACTN